MSSTRSDRLKFAGEIALDGLRTTLQVAKDVSSSTGVPGLAGGISGLAVILDAVQQTSDNVDSAQKLIKRVEELDHMLQNVLVGENFPPPIAERVQKLMKKWESEGEETKKLQSRTRLRRFLGSKKDAKAVAEHLEAIDQSIRHFVLESTLRIEVDVRGLRDDHQAQEVKALLDRFPHSKAAHFDYAENTISRTECMDRTREDILQKLYQWIGTSNAMRPTLNDLHTVVDGKCARIFWINGMAGTGKTTIAYTVSKHCREFGIPLATFFCSRDDAETSNPNLVFPTIARQLGIINKAFAKELSRTSESHPDIFYSALSHQLEILLVKPLNAVKDQFPPCIIVLDALDECKDDSSTSIILSSLMRHINNLPAVRFLITSRPEPNITQGFRLKALQAVTQPFNLHEEALETVEKDIGLYLTESLHGMGERYEIEETWPTSPDIKSLTYLSEGLFIYAATAVKFIGDPAYAHPKQQFDRLLHNQGGEISSLTQRLDELYTQILKVALSDISAELQDMVKLVLGSIVVLRDPLSALNLEHLLNLEIGSVKRALRRLHSALDVPEGDHRVIRLIHPSFYDFIIDTSRCVIPGFSLLPMEHHEFLARACLETLSKGLRRDICDIRDPSKLNHEVYGIQTRIASCISPPVQYACRHWTWHLCRSLVSEVLLEMMQNFLRVKLLYWIEACSLLGELRAALVGLDEVQRWLATSANPLGDITELLSDGERFIREFFPALSTASLHTYHSALAWTPPKSLLHATYEHELVDTVKPLNPISRQWSPCLHTLEGHTGNVSSVAFSRDGSKIISGSTDHTVRLWDAVTGALLKTLEGHRGSVKSVAVSFDDSMIISGSTDDTNDTIRVWDMVTDALLRVLEPHSAVLSVASSPKTHWIVSSGDSHVIHIWDISDGTLLRTLKGHTSEVSSVAFSNSGEWIASGAHDHTVRLWHAESGALQATFEGHSRRVSTVAFSLDDKTIISGSDDCTARVWDIASGSLLLTRTFDDPVWSLAHFPLTNEVTTALGSEIKTWDVATGNVLRTLEARDTGVQFLALSQDGTRIASGGFNQKIQIWQAQAASPETDRPWKVGLVKFSPDGLHAVSSLICRMDIWNAITGSLLRTLKGHTSSITTISFSANSAKLLSGSGDRTIRLWEVDTGSALRKLDGHGAAVVSAEFSRCGAQIVSSSKDGTIRIWDTATGVTVQTITIGVQIHFTCASLFPNGKQFAVVVDNVVQIWDLVSGDLQKTLEGYWSHVLEIAFSVDGTQIASSCYDGTVHTWDGATGAELQAFKTQGTPCRLMYSSDERSIFTNLGPIMIPKENLPVRRPNSAGMQSFTHNPGYFMRNGWLWTQRPERRICWIPPAWRPRELMFQRDLLTWSGYHVAFGTADKIVFIDTTDLAIYLNHLY